MLTEKKDLLTINHKSAETKLFDGVTYPCKFNRDMDLIQVANYVVSKKSEKRSTLANLYKVQTGYCVYTNMFVLVKWNVNVWDECYLYYPYFPISIQVPPKAKKSLSILLKYP